MNILVYVICLLVSTYNSTDITQLTWSDLVKASPENYYVSWYSKESCSEILYATNNVNIRTQPKKEATKLGYIITGEPIRVTAKTDNNWYEVNFEGRRGYVSSEYLTKYKAGLPIKYNELFYYVGNTSEEELQCTIDNWLRIPISIRNSFNTDGSKIVVTDENLGLRFHNDEDMSVLGVTSFYPIRNNCEIYVSNKSGVALIHEIGHYIDGKLNFTSSSELFKQIWGSEVSNIELFHKTNEKNISSVSEYFAECCNLYIINNEGLRTYCPLTYDYIDNCFKEFE